MGITMSPSSLIVSTLAVLCLVQVGHAAVVDGDDRGIFDSIIGKVMGTTTTPAPVAPTDMIKLLFSVLTMGDTSEPMAAIGNQMGVKKEPLPNPFKLAPLFLMHEKVRPMIYAAGTMDVMGMVKATADLSAHLVLQQIFYDEMFYDSIL